MPRQRSKNNDVDKYDIAEKSSVFGVILVFIFPHSDWIRRGTEYFSAFSTNAENADPNNSEYVRFSCSLNRKQKTVYTWYNPRYHLWYISLIQPSVKMQPMTQYQVYVFLDFTLVTKSCYSSRIINVINT